MSERCHVCGTGRTITEVTFDDGGARQIHWTLWSCGHSARATSEPGVDVLAVGRGAIGVVG